jgi:hypothetical protein
MLSVDNPEGRSDSVAASSILRPGVEGVAEAVAEEVEGEDDEGDGETGEGGHPPGFADVGAGGGGDCLDADGDHDVGETGAEDEVRHPAPQFGVGLTDGQMRYGGWGIIAPPVRVRSECVGRGVNQQYVNAVLQSPHRLTIGGACIGLLQPTSSGWRC